jgi:hypothetical protein
MHRLNKTRLGGSPRQIQLQEDVKRPENIPRQSELFVLMILLSRNTLIEGEVVTLSADPPPRRMWDVLLMLV